MAEGVCSNVITGMQHWEPDIRHHPSQNQTMGDSSKRNRRDDIYLATLVKILYQRSPKMIAREVAVAMPKIV